MKGHVIIFRKDLVNFVETLPRNSDEIEILVIVEERINFKTEYFQINPKRILMCLQYLSTNVFKILNDDSKNIYKVNIEFDIDKLTSFGIDCNSNSDQIANIDKFTHVSTDKFIKDSSDDSESTPSVE
jgi:hypothetical protein